MKKKYYISTFLITLVLIISIYYVFYKENEIEIKLDRGRLILHQTIRNIEIEKFPIKLQLDFDKLLKDFKSVSLTKVWSTDIEFDITHPPFFDLKNIYLISFDKIAVYDKNTMQNIWKKQVESHVRTFTLIDGNNILITDAEGAIYNLNRGTGEISWFYKKNITFLNEYDFSLKPIQITYNDDKRFLLSVLIIPLDNDIKILDILTGNILFTLEFDDYIYHVSEYDQVENALYVAYGDKLAKLLLEKK